MTDIATKHQEDHAIFYKIQQIAHNGGDGSGSTIRYIQSLSRRHRSLCFLYPLLVSKIYKGQTHKFKSILDYVNDREPDSHDNCDECQYNPIVSRNKAYEKMTNCYHDIQKQHHNPFLVYSCVDCLIAMSIKLRNNTYYHKLLNIIIDLDYWNGFVLLINSMYETGNGIVDTRHRSRSMSRSGHNSSTESDSEDSFRMTKEMKKKLLGIDLQVALRHLKVRYVDELITLGADVNVDGLIAMVPGELYQYYLKSPRYAYDMSRPDLDCLYSLLRAGADPNINYDKRDYYTPLMIAVNNNNIECVRMLMDAGADPYKLNNFVHPTNPLENYTGNENALTLARKKEYGSSIIRMLLPKLNSYYVVPFGA